MTQLEIDANRWHFIAKLLTSENSQEVVDVFSSVNYEGDIPSIEEFTLMIDKAMKLKK